jgi:hypothetical protein
MTAGLVSFYGIGPFEAPGAVGEDRMIPAVGSRSVAV